MKITDFLSAEMVIPRLQGRTKTAVIREMAEWLARSVREIDVEKLVGVLLEREKIGSTAIGEGVAIPHGKLAEIDRVRGVFGRSPEGVDFDSIDGCRTHLFFLLVAPENSPGDHLKALARISRLLQDAQFRARLMKAESGPELFDAIKAEDDKV
ncbi:MAG TPA: PTS sugar transporter subunit IIA [Candidatus Acidoferrales bacterium]|nr:PTS sugar transporter subunit IIA [Candidatus Acidoferrales bacterium]